MARRSLKPQLNQIRTWVRQGRTDAWIAHQLQVTVKDIDSFKREYELVPGEATNGEGLVGAPDEDLDLRAEDDALVAAALEEEADEEPEDENDARDDSGDDADGDGDDKPKRRRRGRRGGRGRPGGGGRRKALEGTFDHGDEGYGLWLDPAIQDDPVYAEHWAGHRPVAIAVEPDRIVIRRVGDAGDADSDD